jgi:arylsulfatase A-like enzyme
MSKQLILFLTWIVSFSVLQTLSAENRQKPNIILIIADDMGWRDTGYSGNTQVKTPVLDEIASNSVQFDYFYAAGQMCCPGRYAILTGRSPLRGGIERNHGIRSEEIILPRLLKQAGYHTAHFGKWHIGSQKTGPVPMGYDHAVWPMGSFDMNPKFLLNDSDEFSIHEQGDGSIAIGRLTTEYIHKVAAQKQPFFITLAFSAPHTPHLPGPEFRKLYEDLPEKDAGLYGEISALDTAIGNVRASLKKLNLYTNTILWFMSDNGGDRLQSCDPAGKGKRGIGARTASVLEWPQIIHRRMRVTMPCGHVDVYPTLMDITGAQYPGQPQIDGISLMPLLEGKTEKRSKPMGFLLLDIGKTDLVKDTQGVWIDGDYQLTVEPATYKGKQQPVRLVHIYGDPQHRINLVSTMPELVQKMRSALEKWRLSVWESYKGNDFPKKEMKTTGRP